MLLTEDTDSGSVPAWAESHSVSVGQQGTAGSMRGFLKDVLEGKVREVRKWIEKGEAVSQYDEYGNTALHLAAEKGFRGCTRQH